MTDRLDWFEALLRYIVVGVPVVFFWFIIIMTRRRIIPPNSTSSTSSSSSIITLFVVLITTYRHGNLNRVVTARRPWNTTPVDAHPSSSSSVSQHRGRNRRRRIFTKQWWQQQQHLRIHPAVRHAVVAVVGKPLPLQNHHISTTTTTSEVHHPSVIGQNGITFTTTATESLPSVSLIKPFQKTHTSPHASHMVLVWSLLQRYTVVILVALTRNTTVRTVQTILKDWYTGYYLRTTLEHVEHQYKKRYDIPACLRSMTRIILQVVLLVLLGRIMEEMVGLTHTPCSYSGTHTTGMSVGGGMSGGCHWWCGLLWLIAVTGPGHAMGVAIATWVPGLRLQFAEDLPPPQARPSLQHILSRPGRIVRYIIDPDQWFREILATRQRRKHHHHPYDSTGTSFDPVRQYALQPFDPDYRMFPATWSTLRILQMIAIAKEMYGTNTIMHTFMHLVLIQQAFNDEWYRTLMCEKRIVWGMIVMMGYTISTISLFWNMMHKPAHIVSSLSILMMTPSVLAVLISFWMNVLVYFERRQTTSRLSSSPDNNNNNNSSNKVKNGDSIQNGMP